MDNTSHFWGQKNATMSDKNAVKEFGITKEEIVDAVNAGELQYRWGSTHGNPWLRLLRVEVEQFVERKHGAGFLLEKKNKKELAEINKELKELKSRIAELEARKQEIMESV